MRVAIVRILIRITNPEVLWLIRISSALSLSLCDLQKTRTQISVSTPAMAEGRSSYWIWVVMALLFKVILIYFPTNLNLGSRPEVVTRLTSLCRLAQGYWLKKSSVSPYARSMYHGSPLLLSILGPLTVKRVEGKSSHFLCSLLFVIADFLTALLIRATGHKLQLAYSQFLRKGNAFKLLESSHIRFSFFLFGGYIGVSLLSPVMHDLWIWRGTGNANFYFATGIAYACLQTVLVVESVSAVLNYDRSMRKQLAS